MSSEPPHRRLLRATRSRPSAIRPDRPDAPQLAARAHLAELSAESFAGQSFSELRLESQHGGQHRPHVVRFEQEHNGVPVLHSRVAVLMTPELALLAVTGRPRSFPEPSLDFAWSHTAAMAAALRKQLGCVISPSDLREDHLDSSGRLFITWQRDGGPSGCQASGSAKPGGRGGPGVSADLLRARAVLVPHGDTLLPAYELDVMTGDGADVQAFHWVLSAGDGNVLERTDLVFRAHRYRVWASADGLREPWDVPHETLSPHPTGLPDGFVPKPLDSQLILIDGLNTNPAGGHDPWLPDDATTTAGNHAVVFGNVDGQPGFSADVDVGAIVSAPGTFDARFDFGLSPLANQTQVTAALVQMFYTINWLHDWYYDSGFTEGVGNAQVENFGRGGADGDPLLGEAMSGAANGDRDDALMVPLPDGVSPVMRMFLWHGPPATDVTLTPGGPTLHSYASFGPHSFNVSAQVAVAVGRTSGSSDACAGPLNDLTGRIALIDRGACAFVDKTRTAQAAGAVGVLMVNDRDGGPAPMGGDDATITIPTMGISLLDGAALKQSRASGAVSATLTMKPGLDRSGSMDSTIVAHEWGHYLNTRLVGPPSTAQAQAMGEGWGDFVALHMKLGPADDPSRAYPIGGFATAGISPDLYFGVRRVPYSTNFDIDPLTFRHIQDGEPAPADVPFLELGSPNSEIHNAGEIWATMLHEAYAGVVARTVTSGGTFEAAQRAMSDYVVAGLLLQTDQSTFTGARDALISAAAASNPSHAQAIAAAFAKRGAGSCAVSPAHDSEDFVGLTESYSLAPDVVIEALEVAPSPQCAVDTDALLDVGEQGTVRISLRNVGFAPSGDFDLRLDAGVSQGLVSFPNGVDVAVAPLAESETRTVEIPVVLRETVTGPAVLPLRVLLLVPQACQPSSQFEQALWVHADAQAGGAADFQASSSGFAAQGELAELVWTHTAAVPPLLRQYHGTNLPRVTDTALVSPALEVSSSEPFSFSFTHHYEFEAAPDGSWDGGVVELSKDGGTSWIDVAELTEVGGGPKYPGDVATGATHELAGRPAYVGASGGYPNDLTTTLQFGTTLAGESVRFRFRIATDGLGGAQGWSLGQVRVSGITNAPFEALVGDTAETCVPQAMSDEQAAGTDAGSGSTPSGGPTSAETETSGGCGCSVPGAAPVSIQRAGWLLAVALAGLGTRRRRGRYQPKRDAPRRL